MPIEYIYSLPEETIAEFKALNILKPFTNEAQAYREAFACTLLYNQGATKKSQLKKVTDLFPYLESKIPDSIEDDIIKHAYKLYKEIRAQKGTVAYKDNITFLIESTKETIENEQNKNNVDLYRVHKLYEFLGVLNDEIK